MASKSLRPKKKTLKRLVASIVFIILGRAIKACYRLDSRVRDELNELPDGMTIRMIVEPAGPFLIIKKEGNKVVTLKETDQIDLDIHFKNIEGALYALMGRKSVTDCFVENRFIILGDITYGTAFVRVMNIVESYLFPKIMTAYLLDNQAPKRQRYGIRIYIGTILGI